MNVRREGDSFVVEEDGELLGSLRRDTDGVVLELKEPARESRSPCSAPQQPTTSKRFRSSSIVRRRPSTDGRPGRRGQARRAARAAGADLPRDGRLAGAERLDCRLRRGR